MKNNLTALLICAISLIALMLTACASDTEKLAELQKNQQQMQQQTVVLQEEIAKVQKKANKYEKLANKYKILLDKQQQEIDTLEAEHAKLSKESTAEALAKKQELKEQLMKSAQDSVHIQKVFKRYTKKASAYREKSQIKLQLFQ